MTAQKTAIPYAAPDRGHRWGKSTTPIAKAQLAAALAAVGDRVRAERAYQASLDGLSPDSVRGFLPGFAYQCGVLLAGSVAYIEALFAEKMSYAAAMSLTAVTVFAGAIIAIAAGREKRGIHFGEVEISE